MCKHEVYINVLVENNDFHASIKGNRLGIEASLATLISQLAKNWNISEKQMLENISEAITFNAMAKEIVDDFKNGGLEKLLEALKK